MARKSAKGKDKKEARKALNNTIIKEQQTVKDVLAKANEVQDLLKDYAAFRRYARNGLELELRFHWGQDLPSTELQWAFALCKANMETIYETSWGWSDADKREELTALKARFLIAFDQDGAPQAYVHFRWEEEDGVPVLYCYEIQLESAVQRKGLGKFLMKFLELLARKAGAHEVMLTVMRANDAAAAMYAALGYVEHEDQPDPKEGEEEPAYSILTKRLVASAGPKQALQAVTNSYQLEHMIFGANFIG